MSMKTDETTVFVYENWSSEVPSLIGTLYISKVRGEEIFSFAYSDEYLKRRSLPLIDPELELFSGRQYSYQKANFGIFSDSSPDRWGRTLIERQERLLAKKEGRKPRRLMASDYLLGVYDESRMGALRFALNEGGPFLSDDGDSAVPPWVELRTLEEVSREFERNETLPGDKWINQLLKPGSSLGGARPKATIRDIDGSLWIAKFPSERDEINVGAWEKVIHDLARICGLSVPDSRIETFSHHGSTFLVKRFDRVKNRRIHFSSAMTMLNKADGASAADGSSYLEIADFLLEYGAKPKADLCELWKRIVFNMAVSNTDDHLRNHGFLLSADGWRLSPAYDMNPTAHGDELALNINDKDNSIDIDLAIEVSDYFRIEKTEAIKQANKICLLVHDSWEAIAKRYGLSRSSIEAMRPAFTTSEWKR